MQMSKDYLANSYIDNSLSLPLKVNNYIVLNGFIMSSGQYLKIIIYDKERLLINTNVSSGTVIFVSGSYILTNNPF